VRGEGNDGVTREGELAKDDKVAEKGEGRGIKMPNNIVY
jgi:hypothetical protein